MIKYNNQSNCINTDSHLAETCLFPRSLHPDADFDVSSLEYWIEILHDHFARCVACEGRTDALFESHANWYQNYHEAGIPHPRVDA